MAILQTFPIKSGSGHTITDNSSPITDRDTLNLIDFDITDDSTNQVTDINPHLLTTAELDEIMSGVPNGYGDMPVLYDERGTEYVVGKYVKADGTIKNIYQRTYIITTGSAEGWFDVPHNITNFEKAVSLDGIIIDVNGTDWLIGCWRNNEVYATIVMTDSLIRVYMSGANAFKNRPCYVTAKYLKTT